VSEKETFGFLCYSNCFANDNELISHIHNTQEVSSPCVPQSFRNRPRLVSICFPV